MFFAGIIAGLVAGFILERMATIAEYNARDSDDEEYDDY